MIWNKKKDGAENPGAETPAAQTTKAPVLFLQKNWKWLVPVVCVVIAGGVFLLKPKSASTTAVDPSYLEASPEVRDVSNTLSGTGTLKDAVNEALRVWTERVEDTYYVLGSVMGPHPYPEIVRDFQKIIGEEIKAQMLEKEGRLPDVLVACVGGGSNAMGMFYDFIEDKDVRLIGVEAAGLGVDNPKNAATMANGKLGIFHGMKSYFLQDEYGQIAPVYSISAGLDYPGIGPEHAYLHDIGRAEYVPATDKEAVDAFNYLSKTEGIIPAIESAHAVAYAMKLAPTLPKDKIMVINISGRGDKDVAAIARYMGVDLHE